MATRTNRTTDSSRRRSSIQRRPLLTALIIIIFVVAILVVFKLIVSHNQSKSENQSSSTETSQSTEATKAEKSTTTVPSSTKTTTDATTTSDPEPTTTAQTPVQHEGTNPNSAEHLTGVITSANPSDTELIIRLNIDQLLQSAGTCTLTLKHSTSGATVTRTAPTIDGPASSTCQGFNVPLSELASGHYQIIVNITADGKTGTIEGSTTI